MQPMTEGVKEFLKKALSLDEKDRAWLADALIESLHGDPDADVGRAWDLEIQRRVVELESHSVKTVPWTNVRERLFRGFV